MGNVVPAEGYAEGDHQRRVGDFTGLVCNSPVLFWNRNLKAVPGCESEYLQLEEEKEGSQHLNSK